MSRYAASHGTVCRTAHHNSGMRERCLKESRLQLAQQLIKCSLRGKATSQLRMSTDDPTYLAVNVQKVKSWTEDDDYVIRHCSGALVARAR